MKKYYGKTWAKIIAWLCALISLSLSMLFGLIVFLEVFEFPDGEFYESSSIRGSLRGIAYDALLSAYHGRPVNSLARDNLGIQVTGYHEDGKTTVRLAETAMPSAWKYEYLLDYSYNPDGDIIEFETVSLSSLPPVFLQENTYDERTASVGRVAMYLSEPQNERSLFYEQWQLYQMIQPYMKTALPGLCISAIVLICAVIWLFGSAGHTVSDQGIHLIWLDRIPCELLAAVIAGILTGLFVIGIAGIDRLAFNFPSALGTAAAMIAVCVDTGFLILMCGLLSFARRIKAKQFLSSSLIVWLLKKIMDFIRIIPLTPKVSIAAAVLSVFNFIAILSAPRSLFHFLVVVLDLIAAVLMIVYAYFAQRLEKRTALMSQGELNDTQSGNDPFIAPSFYKQISADLDRISEGIEAAVEKQLKAERLKTELITNVSHDIRTPLTSIISYTDLLSRESDENKKTEYLEALKRNGTRLQKLSEDLIEASKASTGNIHAHLEKTDLKEMIEQALGEYEEKLSNAKLMPVVNLKEEPLYAMADGRLLWRVMSNLLSNCVKYAQPDTRVYIEAKRQDDHHVCIVIKNISKDILNISSEELMERFVRGDASRSGEGSGLGLNIAQSLCKVMNGSFVLDVDGDLFKTMIVLPEAE